MSIRTKLVIIFLAIALIPLILVSVLTFNNYKRSLEANQLLLLQDLAAFKADKIEAYFSGLRRDIGVVQKSYLVRKDFPVLVQFINDPANPEFINAQKILDEVLQKTPSVLGLFDIILANPEGKIVYATNLKHHPKEFLNRLPDSHYPHQKAVEEGKNSVYFSDIFLNREEGNKPSMLVSAPAFDLNGVFSGVILFEVDMAEIYKVIQDVTGLGNTGETLIAKKIDNHVLFLNPLRHSPEGALKKRINIGENIGYAAQQAAQGREGAGQFIDYRGTKVIGAWRYIPSLNWAIVAKMDAREAFADVINLRNLLIIILVVTFALCGIIAFFLAQSISGPIKRLSQDAEIIGSGNLDYKVATNLKGEIGQLSRAFDKMTRDLKRNNEVLGMERRRFNEVLDALPAYVVLLTPDYQVPFANRYFRERFGESNGRRCFEYLFKRNQPCDACETFKVLKTVSPHSWEWKGPDGRIYDIHDFPFTDIDGSTLILEMGIDITERKVAESELEKYRHHLEELVKERTSQLEVVNVRLQEENVERKQAEESLKESEQRLNRAQEIAHLGSWELDLVDNRLLWSDEVYRIFGLKPQEFNATYEAFLEAVHPEDRTAVDITYSESVREGKNGYEIEHRVIRKSDGQVRVVYEKCEHIRDEAGKIIRSLGMVHDITERKIAEQRLVRAKEEWERTFNSVPDLITIVDNQHRIVRVNEAMARNLKLNPEECAGLFCYKHVHGLDHPPIFCPHAQSLKDGKQHIEEVHEDRLGGDFLVSTTPLFDEKGSLLGTVHVARDITERKKIEASLRQTSDYLEKLFNYANAPIICWDTKFKITRFNHASERLTNYLAQEVLGKNLSMLFPEDSREESLSKIRRTLSGEQWEVVEIPILRKDGDIRIALWNSANVYADDGKTLLATIAQGQDITARKKITEALREVNRQLEQRVAQRTEELIRAHASLEDKKRLSDIGTLAATVAHELRNPLAAIKLAAYNIKRKADNPLLDKHISNIDTKVSESEQIIDNLLFYSRLKMPHFENAHIYEILNECIVSTAERFAKFNVTLEKDIGHLRGIAAEIDLLQIKEVFNNILNNAFDALFDRKGKIKIGSAAGDNSLIIYFKDDGMGIDKEHLDKIFDPFFTTKAKGTGLGLAVCFQVMRLHNGKIHVESEKGKGTTVTLTLPIRQQKDA